ncbi:unnamed protein product [Polarella glacialis]|uniref:Hexose transporter 1 n=1 Tax=Polarella glacialis TaxID=89957 RepID=A0A813FDU1_POLGL|nr:unnamed protein product [Polarella glacialis]
MGDATDVDGIQPPAYSIATQAVYNGVIGSFLYGYMLCCLNSCGGLLPVVFNWCNSDWQGDCLNSRINSGLINAILYLGAAAGALLTGRPFMARGARFQLIVSDWFFIVGGLVGACAMGFQCLLVSRILSGVGLGISAIAAPLYIAEVSPREVRGFHSAKHGLYIAVGLLAAEVIGIPQGPPPTGPHDLLAGINSWYWRGILAFPAFLALLQVMLMQWALPIDPPSFLVQQGRIQDARRLLYKFYGITPPSPCLEGNAASLQNKAVVKLELQIQDLATATAEAKAIKRITIAQAICDPFLRCSLCVGFFLASFQQLTGINALMAYSNGLFAEAGTPPQYLELASVTMCVANVLVSFLSTKLVDGWGRRTLLLWGATAQAISMAAMIYLADFVPEQFRGLFCITCFSIFVVSFSAGLGAITWLWLSEIYPMEIRGPALSACGVVKWLSCFAVVLVSRFLNLRSSCILFGSVSAIGTVGMWLWIVETKGCSMEDSPMTPRSGRSNSTLMSPKDAAMYQKMVDDEEDEA